MEHILPLEARPRCTSQNISWVFSSLEVDGSRLILVAIIHYIIYFVNPTVPGLEISPSKGFVFPRCSITSKMDLCNYEIGANRNYYPRGKYLRPPDFSNNIIFTDDKKEVSDNFRH